MERASVNSSIYFSALRVSVKCDRNKNRRSADSHFVSELSLNFSTPMFYSPELLSLRGRAKLARCWAAAMFSEEMFRKTCRPSLIKKIDVVVICEEILSAVEIRRGSTYGRFSLYLSAQLMYGVTKILFYQTKLFQGDLFEINTKLAHGYRLTDGYAGEMYFEVPDVPPVNDVLQNLEGRTTLHLITEEFYTSAMEELMRDELNFGVLSNLELENFMSAEADESSLSEIRKFRWDQSTESIAEPVPVDVSNLQIEDAIETETETRLSLARREQPGSSDIVEDAQISKLDATTSRKRSLKSPPEETPRKRSRISLVEELMPSQPPMLVPIPEAEIVPELHQITLPAIEDVELVERPKQKRRKKLFDKQNKLSDDVMKKCIENVTVHTRAQQPYIMTLISAAECLTKPSTYISGTSWGTALIQLYNRHLVKPLAVENDFQDIPDFEEERTIETVVADTTAKLVDQISGYLSKIGITITDTTDTSKTLKQAGENKESEEFEELHIALPEIAAFELQNGAETTIVRKSVDEQIVKKSSIASSSSWSKTCLNKTELLALMEIRWQRERLIKFSELIPPKNYTKFDAACAFRYCLEFEAQKVVILKQADPFDAIWIEKYPYYSSENSEDHIAA